MSISVRDVPPETPGAPDFSITNKLADPPVPVAARPAASPRLFGRMWALVVAAPKSATPIDTMPDSQHEDAMGGTIDLSPFHIVFSVETGQFMVPWKLQATVHNVPDDIAKQITDEYTEVTLDAGYQHARYGQIFEGQIVYFEKGKEANSVDTFLRITAATKDIPQNQMIINKRLPAGTTGQDVASALIGAMAPYGVSPGVISAVSAMKDQKSTRERLLYGMPTEILRDLTQTIDGFSFIDSDGKLHILGPGESLPNPAIEVNAHNGMVNVPAQQIGAGLVVQTLMNYEIRPGCLIKLNNADINKVITSQTGVDTAALNEGERAMTTAPIADDGIYTAWSVTHHGDTRGNPWYTEVHTMGIAAQGTQGGIG